MHCSAFRSRHGKSGGVWIWKNLVSLPWPTTQTPCSAPPTVSMYPNSSIFRLLSFFCFSFATRNFRASSNFVLSLSPPLSWRHPSSYFPPEGKSFSPPPLSLPPSAPPYLSPGPPPPPPPPLSPPHLLPLSVVSAVDGYEGRREGERKLRFFPPSPLSSLEIE